MDPGENSAIVGVAPVFVVDHVARSCGYYTDKLFFSVGFLWSETEGAPPNYAVLEHGTGALHLTTGRPAGAAIAYVLVDGVDRFYVRVKTAGAHITHEIANQPWDMREFEVKDPDGNRLIFAEHVSRISDQPSKPSAATD